MTYHPGQVKVLFPYLHLGIEQFILGGPCDGDEAQVFHEHYPEVSITGFEPNENFYLHQKSIGFPGELYQQALYDSVGEMPFLVMGAPVDDPWGRGSRIHVQIPDTKQVATTTLDSVFHPAPSESIALWIDIERSELKALQGAKKLLESGAISVIMLEAMGETIEDLKVLLATYCFQRIKFFNNHDYIFCHERATKESDDNSQSAT